MSIQHHPPFPLSHFAALTLACLPAWAGAQAAAPAADNGAQSIVVVGTDRKSVV